MSDFQNLSNTPDLLNTPQNSIVMLVAHLVSGIEKEKLDPEYFDFSYTQIDTERVKASFTGRAYSTTGKRGIWSGTKSIELTRAKLNRGSLPIVMVIPFRNGMTYAHILRALTLMYQFNVTAEELWLKDPVTGLYGAFNESSRPTEDVLNFRFSINQGRIIPVSSEFQVRLDNSNRPDINDYLHLIKAGSVLGGL